MLQTQQQRGITFTVDEVDPAPEPLPECRTHEAVKRILGGEVESCCDYHGMVIQNVNHQPLLAAVHTAFSEHRPLVLTPDAVWITIAQGVAHHMALHGEQLRSNFVSHERRLELGFHCVGWVEGSPENPWLEAFANWAEQIRDHVGLSVHDALVCDFSTSGPIEKVASQIVMMDVFERYFHYVLYCICGIPTVTLEGTPADWKRLSEKVAGLRAFDLDWWLDQLLPICEQFVRASRGDIDLVHWRGICKLREEYGGDVINGWIARLFPYLRAYADGPCNRRNPIFETGEGFQSVAAPSGLSRVPFTWRNESTGRVRKMEAIAGLVGIAQDTQTFALRPVVGWAVREANKMDVLLARLEAQHHALPPVRMENDQDSIPPDLAKFYHQADGAQLFAQGDPRAIRIVSQGEMERLQWGEVAPHLRDNDCALNGHIWYRLAHLPDGSWMAINPHPPCPGTLLEQYRQEASRGEQSNCFAAICHCEIPGRIGERPVVALSFTELIERTLDSCDRPYWLSPTFIGYGDAEQFTRK